MRESGLGFGGVRESGIGIGGVTLDTSHFERSSLNDVAHINMSAMSLALDTSHFEMSPLNDAPL